MVSPYEILVIVLLVLIVILIVIIGLIGTAPTSGSNLPDFPYYATPNLDSTAVNTCGNNRNQPCIFSYPFLSQAFQQCTELGSVCSTFTYNEGSKQMKVVNQNLAFTATNVNLFSKT